MSLATLSYEVFPEPYILIPTAPRDLSQFIDPVTESLESPVWLVEALVKIYVYYSDIPDPKIKTTRGSIPNVVSQNPGVKLLGRRSDPSRKLHPQVPSEYSTNNFYVIELRVDFGWLSLESPYRVLRRKVP